MPNTIDRRIAKLQAKLHGKPKGVQPKRDAAYFAAKRAAANALYEQRRLWHLENLRQYKARDARRRKRHPNIISYR